MKVNLNSNVTVKLTEHGRSAISSHVCSVAGAIMKQKFDEHYGLPRSEVQRVFEESVHMARTGMDVADDGTFSCQFWKLMQIFGNSIGNGYEVFDDMNVEVEQADA